MIRDPCRAAGFTLVEVVVALAVGGLVSLLLLHGIGLAAHGLDRLSQHAERLDQRRSLEILLRRALATAIPVAAAGEPGFIGKPTSLSFLSLVDDGGPGLYRVTLTGDTASVTITRRLAVRSAAPRRDESTLMRRIQRFEIGYFGAVAPTDEPVWHRQWSGIAHLPLLVRITLDGEDSNAAPPLLIRLPNAS